MALPEIFSRRKRRASGEAVDVYTYHEIPNKLRVQVIQIILEGLGEFDYANRESWGIIVRTMRKEKGVFELAKVGYGQDIDMEFGNWLLNEKETEIVIDAIEVAFAEISDFLGGYKRAYFEKICNELNGRFQEAGIGYEFNSGQMVQISQQVIHDQVVKPALHLLSDRRFKAAQDEYLEAHSLFRNSKFEQSLVECGKAFESVLKVIAGVRKWDIGPNDPASKLIAAAFNSGFIPTYMQAQFNSLRSMLESGVPAVRNRMGGHGAGSTPRTVDRHLAAYQLHQTAAAIVFLVEHDKATP
ncbi:hypothetical protein OLX02_01615 [Novosphingobium sp. KCTC 2891]|uniref:STM4504/CBY_0614 family protein n=1 Tax=Novosphingobium sp. KCTC 2891 TaxID=2989730 RepID=UPI002223650F|nr:hypothetical protein [Novosphingobium sp. KCTC 2891]MCW1381512.1 hypothetical protein [Novosphingobium sp. KCTC 2891]